MRALCEASLIGIERGSFAVRVELASPREPLINNARKRLITIGEVDSVQNSIAAARVPSQSERRRIGHTRSELDALIIGNVIIRVQAPEIGRLTPGAVFDVVYPVVSLADLVVASECRPQEKWRREQIVDLDAIRLRFSTDHPVD